MAETVSRTDADPAAPSDGSLVAELRRQSEYLSIHADALSKFTSGNVMHNVAGMKCEFREQSKLLLARAEIAKRHEARWQAERANWTKIVAGWSEQRDNLDAKIRTLEAERAAYARLVEGLRRLEHDCIHRKQGWLCDSRRVAEILGELLVAAAGTLEQEPKS